MVFCPLGNVDHVFVLVYSEFPSSSKGVLLVVTDFLLLYYWFGWFLWSYERYTMGRWLWRLFSASCFMLQSISFLYPCYSPAFLDFFCSCWPKCLIFSLLRKFDHVFGIVVFTQRTWEGFFRKTSCYYLAERLSWKIGTRGRCEPLPSGSRIDAWWELGGKVPWKILEFRHIIHPWKR